MVDPHPIAVEDAEARLRVVLGTAILCVRDLLKIGRGAVVELDRKIDAPSVIWRARHRGGGKTKSRTGSSAPAAIDICGRSVSLGLITMASNQIDPSIDLLSANQPSCPLRRV